MKYNKVIEKSSEIERSARVMQLEGLFDVPPSARSGETWRVEFDLPSEWNIGLLVGPSGCGKTIIANELWGENMIERWGWSDDKSLLDDFPAGMSIKEITALLNSVGFSSPPSWVRPYRVLSTGEKFRVHIARTLAEKKELAVVDEFTSTVDRTVAQIGSAAIAKAVRKRKQRLIAISCHYDIIDWLEPDWVYQPHTNEFYSGRYLHQRPSIELEIKRVHHSAWHVFRKHHYLDHNLNKSARCYCAFIHEEPVAFCAVLSFPHRKTPSWRISRIVVLPDYQGIGIGVKLMNFLGGVYQHTDKPFTIVMTHPGLVRSCLNSKDWYMYRKPQRSPRLGKTSKMSEWKVASSRNPAGFKYVGQPVSKEIAHGLL